MSEVLEKNTKNYDKTALIDNACKELLTYGLWDGKTRCKRFVKKYILRRPTATEDLIFWPTGLLAEGLWHCLQEVYVVTADKEILRTEPGRMQTEIETSLATYFVRWQKKGCPVTFLDDLLAGEVFLKIYEEYQRNKKENAMIGADNAETYLQAIEKLATYVHAYPTDETGSFPYRANQQNGYVFVDSIGLTCPFLYGYGRVFEKSDSMELAVKQIANFLAYGMDAATGLPYHGYDVASGTKYGIIGWGRAVGWLLRGMTGCMTTDYGLELLREPYLALMDAVLSYQRKDGYFSWQLQAMEGPADTSATGMICVALQEGIRRGFLQGGSYAQVLEKGIRAVRKSTKNGKVYDCSGECEGFSQYPQRYGAYPWALGAALVLDE
ncbi:MAG: glycoside hydrolase family 88 protein [Lachnospiraceae bacterium]|nr:glycoside hydrolase family 88 protein [Lachnospiraceae bacterium]